MSRITHIQRPGFLHLVAVAIGGRDLLRDVFALRYATPARRAAV